MLKRGGSGVGSSQWIVGQATAGFRGWKVDGRKAAAGFRGWTVNRKVSVGGGYRRSSWMSQVQAGEGRKRITVGGRGVTGRRRLGKSVGSEGGSGAGG